jgi:alpha-beta hydrolase superfamily lysophospholipase
MLDSDLCFLFQQGAFLEKIKSENPGVPCFLFGHSTGGAVVLKVRREQTHTALSYFDF